MQTVGTSYAALPTSNNEEKEKINLMVNKWKERKLRTERHGKKTMKIFEENRRRKSILKQLQLGNSEV